MSDFFGQTFDPNDLLVIGLLVVLEGVLSIDNALVLGLLARRVPKDQQKKALTYGLIGALVFRLAAIAVAQQLLRWRIVKLLGGLYLIYVAVKHFFFENSKELKQGGSQGGFWATVAVIELTDIAFAVDSILAAIALVGSSPEPIHPKLWVVVAGGFVGVILMRVAAAVFIRLLEKFPRFEMSAYLLVLVIGAKLVADWHWNVDLEHPRLHFHSPSDPIFWVFWGVMAVCIVIGFLPAKGNRKQT